MMAADAGTKTPDSASPIGTHASNRSPSPNSLDFK